MTVYPYALLGQRLSTKGNSSLFGSSRPISTGLFLAIHLILNPCTWYDLVTYLVADESMEFSNTHGNASIPGRTRNQQDHSHGYQRPTMKTKCHSLKHRSTFKNSRLSSRLDVVIMFILLAYLHVIYLYFCLALFWPNTSRI